MRTIATRAAAALALLLSGAALPAQEAAPAGTGPAGTGNVVFFHADGTGVNHWLAARIHTVGPDGELQWDRLPGIAVYIGHMADRLTATSHGAATTHAYGVKVPADSFGLAGTEEITAASGRRASVAEEAMAAGKALALIQSGAITEPGTAAFVASVGSRKDEEEIARQVIESGAEVILAGGEQYLLPEGVRGRHGEGVRTDGLNLVERARELGYVVVHTREELLALDPAATGKVLGLFAADHTFDAGQAAGEDGSHYAEAAPSIAEMADFALRVVSRDPDGFLAVVEEEGTDNMSGSLNAEGALEALRRADEAVGALRAFVDSRSDTLLLVAADSDAGGLQVLSGDREPDRDGLFGGPRRHSDLLLSAPDARGQRHPFRIVYAGDDDVAGGVLVRAAGPGAGRLEPLMDNTDLYRLIYETLLGPLPGQ